MFTILSSRFLSTTDSLATCLRDFLFVLPRSMGRGKVELKRITDKSSRQVSFSKRRNGLMKKSQELAVLCDVDVAVFVFSGGGRLYEFSTGERMTEILTRYECFKKTEGQSSININKNLASEQRDVGLMDQLMEMIQRRLDKDRIKQLDITGLNQLEQQLASFLQQVRTRETEIRMGVLKALKDKEMKLKKERKLIMNKIKGARTNVTNHDSSDAAQPQPPMTDTQINQ